MKASLMAVAIAAVVAVSLVAAQGVDPQTVAGSWKPFPAKTLRRPYQAPAWLTDAVVKELGEHLAEVAEVFHRAPFLASPVGWVMFQHPWVHLDRGWADPSRTDRRWIVAGRLGLRAAKFEADGKTVYDVASAFGLNATANDLDCAVDNQSHWARDEYGTMFLEVEPPKARVHGFPRYKQCVLLTHRPAPMFVPVTLERVVALRLAVIEKRVSELRGVVDVAPFEPIVRELRATLAGLSPERRKGPAYATGAFLDDPLSFDRGRRIVEANPNFFDPARPADIQVLTIFNDCVHAECVSYDVVDTVIRELDWKALEALVR